MFPGLVYLLEQSVAVLVPQGYGFVDAGAMRDLSDRRNVDACTYRVGDPAVGEFNKPTE